MGRVEHGIPEASKASPSDREILSPEQSDRSSKNGGARRKKSPSRRLTSAPNLRSYIDILMKRRTLALGVFAVIFVSVASYAFLAQPIYRSVAVLIVEGNSLREVDPKDRIGSFVARQNELENALETLKSRALAETLVDELELADSEDFLPSQRGWIASIRKRIPSFEASDEKESESLRRIRQTNAAADAVEGSLSVKQRGKSQLLELTVDAHGPILAQSILRAYLNLFFETELERWQRSNRESLRWLEEELGKVEAALVKSEAALVRFIAEHGIVPSEDGGMTQVVDMISKKRDGVLKARQLEAKLEGLKDADGSVRFEWREGIREDEMLKKLKMNLAELATEYAQLRTAYSGNAPQVRLLKRKMKDIEQRIAAVQHKSVSAALKAAQKEAAVLSRGVATAKEEAVRLGSLGSRYAILKRDVDTNKELHKILLERLKETQLKARTGRSRISVIDPPSLPLTPVRPKKGLLLFVGLLLGCSGSMLVVFVRHFLEEHRQTTTEVENEFDMPTLGMVPDASQLAKLHQVDGNRYEFLTYDRPNSPVADSIRNIHTSILFTALGAVDVKSLAVSSAKEGEGKTFISISLATALTCSNSTLGSCVSKRILIVDCDMRRPSVHTVFPMLVNSGGLSTLLTTEGTPAESVINKHDQIPGLYFMTAGPRIADPAALLLSGRFKDIVEELTAAYDFIIYDSPPTLGFPDIRVLCRYSDGVVLVVDERRFDQDELRSAAEAIASAGGAKILGLVLNRVRPGRSSFVYAHYYYSRNGKSRRRR